MDDPTINSSDSQSLNLHDDTQIYLCARPSVRLFEVDVLEQVRSILNIRKSGFDIARAVLIRQGGENIAIELSQDKFAEAIWPDKEPGARIKQFKRGVKNMREDAETTGFLVVDPQKQKPKLTEDGFKGRPTLYAPGMYWQLSNALQERAKKIDFFAMPLDQRRKRVRTELKAILKEMGCVRRVAEKKIKEEKEKEQKEKSPKLCPCGCSSCEKCEYRISLPARIDKLRRQPNEVFAEELDKYSQWFYQRLSEIGECNQEWRNRIKQAYHVIDMAQLRSREMIEKENKRESRQRLKLVGGQSR